MNERRMECLLRNNQRLRKVLALSILVSVAFLVDPGTAAAADTHPLKPADTSSPRATLKSFIDNMNSLYQLVKAQGKQADPSQTIIFKRRATRCLDLSKIEPAAVEDVGEKRAVLLTEILDRIELPPLDAVPDAGDGKANRITRWRIPDTEIAIVEVSDGPRQGDFLFSSETVSRIPEFYDRVKTLPYRPGTVLPGAFEKLFTSGPPTSSEDDPLKPADTSSPQATLKSFIDNMNALYRSYKGEGRNVEAYSRQQDSHNRALRCLNLSKVPANALEETATQSAVLLTEVFDRIKIPPYEEIPGANEVKKSDFANWSIPNTEITIARVEEGPRQGDFLFTPETVRRATEFYSQVQHLPYKEGTVLEDAYNIYLQSPGRMIPITWIAGIPTWMRTMVLDQPVWKWLALIGIGLLLVGGLVVALRLGIRRGKDAPPASFRKRLVFPLSGLCLALLASAVVEQIRVVQNVAFLISVLLTLLIAFFIAWLIGMVNNAIADLIVTSPRIGSKSIDAQMVRVAFRILSLAAFVVIIVKTADNLGIPLTPVVAGLGVGGVAVALAAQNSLENLIGGFNLFMDRPIRVGDFCRFGNWLGTIEEIGLRSTRVRTLDDTVISIPNATFSKMELENYSKRRKIWYHPRIQLTKTISPDQVRFVLVEVRKMLYAHPKVDPNPARIRFAEFGVSSLDLDIFAYVTVTDYGEYLQVAEDLNLRIMDILAQGGVSLGVPMQQTIIAPAKPRDLQRIQEAEKQVQQWREHNQLYLPSFPEEVVSQLRGTLDYPPKGAPTGNEKELPTGSK